MIMASRTVDADGVEELMASCEGIIVKLAKRYFRPLNGGITLEELMHEARVATWKAAERWQKVEDKRAKFSTYAWNAIRHDLYFYVCQTGSTIYVPRQGSLERRKAVMVHVESMDVPLNSWGGSWHDFIAEDQTESHYSDEELDMLLRAMRLLNERDRRILKERFFEERTLESVARDKGVTREAVRQLQVKAMKKLKLRIGELNRSRPMATRNQEE